jgi:hypothetical protein
MKNNNNNNSMQSFEMLEALVEEGAGEQRRNFSKRKLSTSFY